MLVIGMTASVVASGTSSECFASVPMADSRKQMLEMKSMRIVGSLRQQPTSSLLLQYQP